MDKPITKLSQVTIEDGLDDLDAAVREVVESFGSLESKLVVVLIPDKTKEMSEGEFDGEPAPDNILKRLEWTRRRVKDLFGRINRLYGNLALRG